MGDRRSAAGQRSAAGPEKLRLTGEVRHRKTLQHAGTLAAHAARRAKPRAGPAVESLLSPSRMIGLWKCGNLAGRTCEISKRRWKSGCDFHGRVISTAVGIVVTRESATRSRATSTPALSGQSSRQSGVLWRRVGRARRRWASGPRGDLGAGRHKPAYGSCRIRGKRYRPAFPTDPWKTAKTAVSHRLYRPSSSNLLLQRKQRTVELCPDRVDRTTEQRAGGARALGA